MVIDGRLELFVRKRTGLGKSIDKGDDVEIRSPHQLRKCSAFDNPLCRLHAAETRVNAPRPLVVEDSDGSAIGDKRS